jgi:hypothetical protein
MPTKRNNSIGQMRWSEPSLVEFEFRFGAKRRPGLARLGFPRLRKGDREWSCSFQIHGLEDSKIRVARGDDGLQALIIAITIIRKSLDRLNPVGPSGEAHEFIFPRVVPSAYGLEAHRNICKIIDADIRKNERQLRRRWAVRKKSIGRRK